MQVEECRKGMEVKVIDVKNTTGLTMGEIGIIQEIGVYSGDMCILFKGNWKKVTRFEPINKKPEEKKIEKTITHIVTWDEENKDPYKLFSSEDDARSFIKTLGDKTNLKKDSIRLFTVKSASKVKIEKVLRLSNYKIA